ncbi:hypothetical protein BVRB_2g034640 [Beta vulgaris subsp. vulgaris]|nr:hypothetical protein BVRB_2g034640 [Beta vulgaris subsp. vulgaris]
MGGGGAGVVIHDVPVSVAKLKLDDKLPPPPKYGKGKGKLLIAHHSHVDDDDSSSDEAGFLPPPAQVPIAEPVGKDYTSLGESLPPICSPMPLRVFCAAELIGDSQLIPSVEFDSPAAFVSENGKSAEDTFLLDAGDDDHFSDLDDYAGKSFQHLTSDNSMVRQIEQLGMDPSLPLVLSSQSGSAKRRPDDMESDDASLALKRKRN